MAENQAGRMKNTEAAFPFEPADVPQALSQIARLGEVLKAELDLIAAHELAGDRGVVSFLGVRDYGELPARPHGRRGHTPCAVPDLGRGVGILVLVDATRGAPLAMSVDQEVAFRMAALELASGTGPRSRVEAGHDAGLPDTPSQGGYQ